MTLQKKQKIPPKRQRRVQMLFTVLWMRLKRMERLISVYSLIRTHSDMWMRMDSIRDMMYILQIESEKIWAWK